MGCIAYIGIRNSSLRNNAAKFVHCFFSLVFCWTTAYGGSSGEQYESNLTTLRALLAQPEHQIDLAVIKLTVDRMIDSAIDERVVYRQLDDMAKDLAAGIPFNASSLARFKALRSYLYQPSSPSGRKPFLYNFDDDRNPRSKLLSVYLATHRGNCVSMPVAFVILGQKLGIPVTLTTAPAHLYVKFRGDDGNWYGVETTSGGGWADDEWQRKQFPNIQPAAISHGAYLQALTREQSAAVILESLLEHYENQRTLAAEEARAKLALLILEHYPQDVAAMAHAHLAYGAMRRKLFVERYPTPADIPLPARPRFVALEQDWVHWGMKARQFGFASPTPAMEAAYRARINAARASIASQ